MNVTPSKLALSLLAASPLFINSMAHANDTEDTVNLDTTVVTATGRDQLLENAPATMSVITAEDLKGKSYRDITDALQDVPGVSVEGGPGRKGGTAEISIRGMASKYTLILVNGKAQGSSQSYYNGVGGGAEMGWLPPLSAIERIEVVRGPMSSLYGSDALGGVINVITKPTADEWGGTLNIDTVVQSDSESGNSRQYRYFLTGPLNEAKTLGLTLFGSRHDREEDSFTYGYKDHQNDNINARVDWQASDNNDFSFTTGYATRDSEGTADNTGESSLETSRRFNSLTHDINWGDYNSTSSYLQHERMRNDTQDSVYERTTFNSSTSVPLDSQTLTLGVNYREQTAEHPTRAINLDTLERWDAALFGEDEIYLTDDFTLTAGLRYVYDEKYGSEITPRVYGVYQLDEQFTLKGGISTGYRTPDLKQGTSDWVEGGGGRSVNGADIGNDDLKPEDSTSYEIGLMWNNKQGVKASITAYQTYYENKITKNVICEESSNLAQDCFYLGEGYQKVYQYMNEDEAELRGFEASIQFPLGPVITSVNYTYSHTEITSGENAGDPLNNYPEQLLNLGLDWQATPKLSLWGKAKYKGESSETDSEYPGYTIVDAGVQYQLKDTVSVYAGAYNLFDEDINYEDYGKTLDGLRFNAGISMEF